MNKIFTSLIGILLLLSSTGCLDSYRDLNTNPEDLGKVIPQAAFTGATENFNNSSRDHLTAKYSTVMVYMQYIVPNGGVSADRYINPSIERARPSVFAPAYQDYYSSVGLRLDNLIHMLIPSMASPGSYADIQAISEILLIYKQWQILDTYGAAPISEAFRIIEGVSTPRYDIYQKALDGTPMYTKLDSGLAKAVETLRHSDDKQQKLGPNDFFYGGDVSKWIKFANTLRVKMAQRLEKADPAFYNKVLDEVLKDPNAIIASNAESCIYHHSNEYNNNTDDIQDITSKYSASQALVNFLKAYDDPRLPILTRRNGFGEGNNNKDNDEWFARFKKEYPDYESKYPLFVTRYVGKSANPDSAGHVTQSSKYLTLKYTNEKGEPSNLQISMYSQIESRFFVKNGGLLGNNNMPAREMEGKEFYVDQPRMHTFTPILTYPETCLMLAEIALKRGAPMAGKDADTWFREGIRSSMQLYREWAEMMFVVAQTVKTAPTYHPISDEAIETYLARPEFKTASLDKIVSQQWINLLMQPEEMWATWKRTSLPATNDHGTPNGGVAFFERVQNAGKDLLIPRRSALPTPNSANLSNYNAAVKQLMNDPKYGSAADRTEGRIWWDMP